MAIFGRKIRIKDEQNGINISEDPMVFPSLPNISRTQSETMIPSLPKMPVLRKLEHPIKRLEEIGNRIATSSAPKLEMKMPKMEIMKTKEPIFVKIDKFNEALSNFDFVKNKLQETSLLLEKVKETRKKEENELNLWASELEAIKAKISLIDKKIFSSLE